MKSKLLIGLLVVLAVVLIVLVKTDRQKSEKMAGIADNTEKMQQPVEKKFQCRCHNRRHYRGFGSRCQCGREGDQDVDYVNQSTQLINSEGIYNENDF